MRRLPSPWAVAACLVAALLLGGCWDYVDIDRRGLLLGLGVERAGSGGVRITADIANPAAVAGGMPAGGEGGAGGRSLVLTQEGATVLEALERLEARLDRRMYIPFIQVLVVGEGFAREGLGGLLDFVLRDPRFRSDLCLVLTPLPPERILSFRPVITHDPAIWLRFVHNNYRESPTFPRCAPFWSLYAELRQHGATLAPRLAWSGPRPVLEGAGVPI